MKIKYIMMGLYLLAAIIDAKKKIIPGFLSLIIGGLGFFRYGSFLFHLNGGIKAFILFFIPNIFFPGIIGGGDVKFMMATGFTLGEKNIMIASIIGIILFLILERDKKGKKRPLGPYLVAGIIIVELII